MDADARAPATSEGAALIRLGLRVALGARGQYIAEYLDDQRVHRIARRLTKLGEFAADEGMTPETLIEQVTDNGETSEFVEDVIDIASKSRYEPKLRYLGRSLAHAIATGDDAIPDMEWIKIDAIRDLQPVHARLLHDIKLAQERRASAAPRLRLLGDAERYLPAVSENAIISGLDEVQRPGAIDAFNPALTTLIRSGLVATESTVDVEVDVDLDIENETAETDPSTEVVVTYRLTALGLQILSEMKESQGG